MPGLAGCSKQTPKGCLLNGESKKICEKTKTDEKSVCGPDYSNKVAETDVGSKERKELVSACKKKINIKKGIKKMYCKAYKDGTKWMAAKEKREKQKRERDERARKRAADKEARRKIKAREKAERKAKKERKFTSEPIPDYIMRALQPKKSVHPEYGKLRY